MLKNFMQICLFLSMSSLTAIDPHLNDVLPDPYPQVYDDVELLPFNDHGWYPHASRFERLIKEYNVKNVLEVGSWLGCSTRHLASLIPEDGKVYAVDHWEGSIEHLQMDVHIWLPTLFQQFLSNVIHMDLTRKIVPVRMPSLEAAEKLKTIKLDIDLIYIDGSHDYEAVYKDLCAWYPYIQGSAIMTGDDWHHGPIQDAVTQFAKENNLNIFADNNFWMFESCIDGVAGNIRYP